MGRARQRKKDRETAVAVPVEASRRERRTAQRRPSISSRTIAGAAIVVLVGIATYANSFSIPFLFDDYFVIVSNPETHALEPLSRFFTQSRGLPHLLDTLNYRWGGEEVWGYHLVNVAIHLANALLVYALALLTLRLPVHNGAYATRAPVLAALIALIFVVHPLQSMAVSYIVQRAESLAAMFYLAALLLFAAGESGAVRLRGAPLALAVLVLGFLGIMSKETVASLPVALFLYNLCFLRRRREPASPGSGWWMPVMLVLPVLYGVYLSRHFLLPGLADDEGGQSAWMYIPSAGLDVEGVTPWRYLTTQFGVIVWYLRLFVLPTSLTFDYGWPFADSVWSASVLAPLAFLLVLVGVAVYSLGRYCWLAFGILWMFATLAPSSSFIPIKDAAFEYRMYLPIVGLAMLVVVGVSDALSRIVGSAQKSTAERGALAFATVCILLLAGTTVARNQVLGDELLLARDSATKAPLHWRNQFALGNALVARGKSREAIAPFERAVELNPGHGTPRIMLGNLYSSAGRLEEAEEVLLVAIDAREESVSAAAYRQLGMIYKAQSYSEAAIGMFEEALVRKPQWRPLEIEIVRLWRHLGRWHDAARRLNDVVTADPSLAARMAGEVAETNLLGGVQSYELGEPFFARRMLSRAMEHPSTLTVAGKYLAYIEVERGNREEAVRILQDLVRRGLGGSSVERDLEQVRAGESLAPPVSTDGLRDRSRAIKTRR